MASFNQSPLGQTTVSTGLSTTIVPGSLTPNATITDFVFLKVIDATSNTPTWYAPSSAVQSEGRRESKMIGLPPSPKA